MNRFRFSFCFLIVVFLCSTPLSAAQKTPQSLRELILFGLETNLGLQTIHLNRPISQASVIVEDAVFDVEIFASADYTDVSTPISSALSLTETSDSQQGSGTLGLHKKLKTGLSAAFSLNTEWIDDNNLTDDLSPRYRTHLLVDLVQPLMRGSGAVVNTTSLQLSQKKHRQTSLESQFEAQILALQIESLVSRVVGAAAIVQLRNEAHQLADELFVANQRRFEVGVIPVSEVLEAEAALADRQLNLSLAVQSRALQFEELNRLFAQELPADFHCSSFYDFKSQLKKQKLPDEEELFASALQKRLDLKISEIDIESAYLQRDFHRNQLKPQLDLKIQVGI
ncbi:MAG: TolC family protein, partial [Chloroflexi bacterium]|nr:TolC family protein [Chloroflexota bacterium]